MTASFLRTAARVAAALCWCGTASAVTYTAPEQQFNSAIELMRSGHPQEALSVLGMLTQREPNFRLAQLFYGELLAILSGQKQSRFMPPLLDDDPHLQDLAEEARVRLAGEKSAPAPGLVPNAVLQLPPSYQHLVVVDLPHARLYVMENQDGMPRLLEHHYAAIGRAGFGKQVSGDLRTPVGLYHITHWIDDAALPELYGAGALPLDYPNAWDRYRNRTGHGIWLHGVPRDTYSRPPRSSEGCVTMANADLETLRRYIRFGQTPVILSDALEWVPPQAQASLRAALTARIEAWRAKWSARDTDAYLAFYADDFSAEGMSRAAFAEHKRRVNASKTFIDLRISDLALLRYPDTEADVVLAEFTLEYSSNNFASTSRKQQFWKRNNTSGQWQIVRESNR